jgi:hypothetical protein
MRRWAVNLLFAYLLASSLLQGLSWVAELVMGGRYLTQLQSWGILGRWTESPFLLPAIVSHLSYRIRERGWDAAVTLEMFAHLGSWLLLWILMLWAVNRATRAGRRYAPGSCERCGYDLRATPERCPECGAASAEAVTLKPMRTPVWIKLALAIVVLVPLLVAAWVQVEEISTFTRIWYWPAFRWLYELRLWNGAGGVWLVAALVGLAIEARRGHKRKLSTKTMTTT